GFLAMNPMGQIPVLVDSEGPGGKPLTLSQSTAILVYCAEKSGRFLPRDPAARAATLQALMSASTDITPMLGALFAVIRSKDPHGPTADLFRSRVRGYFKVWDDYLGQRKYCAGGELTIADLSLYAGYARAKGAVPETCEGLPNLERWAKELGGRPAIQRATKF
ncbi:MAG TPA: glutathione S-transferase family protein, partial [Burkholderiales bacterium]|nr:glutathione S-transferase family protein [Burkholderiales bacterium]